MQDNFGTIKDKFMAGKLVKKFFLFLFALLMALFAVIFAPLASPLFAKEKAVQDKREKTEYMTSGDNMGKVVESAF